MEVSAAATMSLDGVSRRRLLMQHLYKQHTYHKSLSYMLVPDRWSRRESYSSENLHLHLGKDMEYVCVRHDCDNIITLDLHVLLRSSVTQVPARRWGRPTAAASRDFLGGAENSAIMQDLELAISRLITERRIQAILRIALRNVPEMVTDASLWEKMPDPFLTTTDSRTWTHYIDSVEYEAGKITPFVRNESFLAQRRNPTSISDVDRAIKRLRLWASLASRINRYWSVGNKDLMPSPVDTRISKRKWEKGIYEIRQSILLVDAAISSQSSGRPKLASECATQSYVPMSGMPRRPSTDYLGGSSTLLPQYEELPVIHAPITHARDARIYYFGERFAANLRIRPGEVPLDTILAAFENANRNIEIITVIPVEGIRTLMFMAVPRFPSSRLETTYCLLRIGDEELDKAVVLPFLPRPSWDGLWSYLDIMYGLLKPRGMIFQLDVNGYCFTESDDLCWLPPRCVARLRRVDAAGQVFLPLTNGMRPAWPRSEEDFARWYHCHGVELIVRNTNRRNLCTVCGKPLRVFAATSYRAVVHAGRLGLECSNSCATVLHRVKVKLTFNDMYVERDIEVPLCVHPVLLELYLSIKYAYGHEATRFELLPGSITGLPTWQESYSEYPGFQRAQGLQSDVCEVGDQDMQRDYLGGSEAVSVTIFQTASLYQPKPLPARTSIVPVLERATRNFYGRDYLAGADSKPRGGVSSANTTLPLEILSTLAPYFCDFKYLHALAVTSTAMLRAARQKCHWNGRDVNLDNQPDLLVTERFRLLARLAGMARSISVNLHQLAMFINIPESVKLCWNVAALPPQAVNSFKFGCISTGPLMGCAEFHVFLPEDVRGLYVGVREFGGERRSYCRVDNVFQDTIMWSMGINQHPVMPHVSARRHAPLPTQWAL